MLVRLLPDEPEPRALLALVLLTEARGPSRTTSDGDLVLLADQDRSRWDRALIREGLALATTALRHPRHGRFALQAAVAGLHATAPRWPDTAWAQIVTTLRRPRCGAGRHPWSPSTARRPAAGSSTPTSTRCCARSTPWRPTWSAIPTCRRPGRTCSPGSGGADEAARAYGDALALTTNATEQRYLARRRRR